MKKIPLPMMEYMSFIYIKLWKMKFMKKKTPYFSFISSMRRNIYLLNIPPQIPPLPFFSDFWEKKKKKSLHKEL
jgi:hypothetical protein